MSEPVMPIPPHSEHDARIRQLESTVSRMRWLTIILAIVVGLQVLTAIVGVLLPASAVPDTVRTHRLEILNMKGTPVVVLGNVGATDRVPYTSGGGFVVVTDADGKVVGGTTAKP